MTTTNQSPASLRAEADRLENEAEKENKGKVFIYTNIGQVFVHSGTNHYLNMIDHREATEAEVAALCIIPEFKAYLEKVRGE